jgi:hypothetical protein
MPAHGKIVLRLLTSLTALRHEEVGNHACVARSARHFPMVKEKRRLEGENAYYSINLIEILTLDDARG